MASLKAIKGKIRSIDKTRKVTKAMEAVSAAKMRKAQQVAIGGRGYAKAAVSILSRLAKSTTLAQSSFLAQQAPQSAVYIVITSDKGLAGSVNSGVLKAVVNDIAGLGLPKEKVQIVAIGRKASDFFSKRDFVVVNSFENKDGVITKEIVDRIVNESLLSYHLTSALTVKVAFQSFISTFEQKPTVRTMLPFNVVELEHIVSEIIPTRGKFAEVVAEPTSTDSYEIEPSAEGILEVLVPKLASIFVYHALLESQASEHSARMVAMKNASDKAKDKVKEFTRAFNKARQAGITREVSEIIGGIEAMA